MPARVAPERGSQFGIGAADRAPHEPAGHTTIESVRRALDTVLTKPLAVINLADAFASPSHADLVVALDVPNDADFDMLARRVDALAPTSAAIVLVGNPGTPARSLRAACRACDFVLETGERDRALVVASRRFAILDGVAYPFYSTLGPSEPPAAGTRQHFLGESHLVKLFRFDGPGAEQNRRELGLEAGFLRQAAIRAGMLGFPMVGETETQGWLVVPSVPSLVAAAGTPGSRDLHAGREPTPVDLKQQLEAATGALAASKVALAAAETARREAERAAFRSGRLAAEHADAIRELEQQVVDMRERHERQVLHYADELAAARTRALPGLADSRDRYARVVTHPLVDTVQRLESRAPRAAEVFMDAPLFTRTQFQPKFVVREDGTYSLDEFLVQHDREFVRAAYLAILRRPADPDGEAYYLAQVRAGEYKSRILDQIMHSEEARAHATTIAGLHEHLRLLRICRLPFVGRWIAAILFMSKVDDHLRELRAFENHVIRMSEEAQLVHEANIRKLRSIA